MNYETISKMKVPELKTKLRGLKVSGKKCELIARVFFFCCWKQSSSREDSWRTFKRVQIQAHH